MRENDEVLFEIDVLCSRKTRLSYMNIIIFSFSLKKEFAYSTQIFHRPSNLFYLPSQIDLNYCDLHSSNCCIIVEEYKNVN